MAFHTIRLQGGEWEYDDSKILGQAGGFGEVFRGTGECGDVAIKRLKISAHKAAHRELKIGQSLVNKKLAHVVPVLDAGQDSESDRYFLVMPVCEFSLQDKINEANGAIDVEIAKSAIVGIIDGLIEVSNVSHRDLKPANILFHDGVWKIADFGIAKFVEDSTSIETLRNSLTPTYAAPEQWKGERPTTATDIYALGCIIHALFTGRPPFSGSKDDIRESHLHKVPDLLTVLAPRFSVFVSHMLRKHPNARPTLNRCKKVLSGLELANENSNSSPSLIDNAAKQVAEREAQEEAKYQEASTLSLKRNELFADAKADLFSIRKHLFSRISNSSDSVKIDYSGRLKFGAANLDFSREPEILDKLILDSHARGGKAYKHTGWEALGWSMISLTCTKTSYTWSSSLLFADLKDGYGFRWYEAGFWTFSQFNYKDEPFGLEGYKADIDLAFGNILHNVNVAYGPLPIDSEDEENFISRWIGLVAKAAIGDLDRPIRMPITDFK
ncbi:MAG: protein kinase [Candidatus Lokiarchaeota archaeon]|nr:protein kinase [Candidatus Lokiarchaeota archaeon]